MFEVVTELSLEFIQKAELLPFFSQISKANLKIMAHHRFVMVLVIGRKDHCQTLQHYRLRRTLSYLDLISLVMFVICWINC